VKSFAISRWPFAIRPFLWVLLISAVLLAPSIFWPFDYDQGTFAYGGWALLHGAKPYIDFWDIKPPNIFYTYAAAFAVFGNSVRAIRLLDYLNALLTVALLYATSIRLWRNRSWCYLAAIGTSFAFILQYYIFGHWNTAQTETYSVPLLLGAFLLILPSPRISLRTTLGYSAIRSVIAGILLGISFYFKFPNGLFLLFILAAIWIENEDEANTKIKSSAWLLAGFIFSIGLESAYLAAMGEFIPLWNLTISETASYISTNYSGHFTVWNNIRTSTQALDSLWLFGGAMGWFAAAMLRGGSVDRRGIRWFVVLVIGCMIALLAVQAGNKGYTYHYAILLPWADLLIGAGLAQLISVLAGIRFPRVAWAAALLFILSVGSYYWSSAPVLSSRILELREIAIGHKAANGYISGDTLSNYVIEHTQRGDSIFIFGFQPYVYWKSGRTPSVKFLNTIHFKPKNAIISERDELVHTLLCNPPALFLVEMADRYTSQGNSNDDSRTTIRLRYPEIEELLLRRYLPVDTIQSTIIYKRTF
jgi:4-amino-4-deoxy-L-arabinose transferase-like glycosyltransferase